MKHGRNYPLLLVSQFLGAFGDNAMLAIILGPLLFMKNNNQITEEVFRQSNVIYTSLLFIPFVLLAPMAGYLSDRFAKTRWLAGGGLIKVAGTLIAMISLVHSPHWQVPGYLIVAIGACLYSPAKYGILPEILPAERLVKSNGTVELLTLVAILAGMFVGATLIDNFPPLACYVVVLLIYGGSTLTAMLMRRTPERPEIKLSGSVSEFFRHSMGLARSPRLGRVLMGTGLFYLCAAVFKMNFQPWGQSALGIEKNAEIALLNIWLAVGIMGGSMLAGQLYPVGDLSRTRRNGYLLAVFLAMTGMIATASLQMSVDPQKAAVLMLLAAGTTTGVFLIPLNAALQAESDPSKLGKTIACQNFVNNVGMIVGAAFVALLIRQTDASGVFIALGALVAIIVTFLRIPPLGTDNAALKQTPENNPQPRRET